VDCGSSVRRSAGGLDEVGVGCAGPHCGHGGQARFRATCLTTSQPRRGSIGAEQLVGGDGRSYARRCVR
jgi:hypothetical protein